MKLHCSNSNVVDNGVAHEILKVYQENNNLTELWINNADLQNGGIVYIDLHECNMTDEQLFPMVEAIRGHRSLVQLYLKRNRIGNAGCGAIATLLSDPISNLHTLNLTNNHIGVDGATILVNALLNNAKLQKLYLTMNPSNQSTRGGCFLQLLCNVSSINNIHSSNHSIETLGSSPLRLLELNEGTNKSHVAIK